MRVLGDTRGFTTARAQVIQLGAAYSATADNGDLVDVGRVQRENTLHTFAKGDLADRERTGDALAVLAADADAFVILHTRTRAFGHLEADANGVAGLEVGKLDRKSVV